MAQRSAAKASGQYKNVSWDLVDAEAEGEVKVEELDESELPEEMKDMDAKERKEYIQNMSKKREKIQAKIKKLNEERRRYIAEQLKDQDNTLDAAILQTVQEQAKSKNYDFDN